MRWAMPWCGRVAVLLVIGQERAQMRLTQN